ncbi:MAG: flippase [Chloroflexi bacterium]|nr:flippase [Chloroflexota bacterium]
MSNVIPHRLRTAAFGDAGMVRSARRVIKNVLWLLFSQGGVRAIGFVLGTVLARYFGAADFGTYMFVMTYVSYFGFLADAGLGRFLIRDVARDRGVEQEYLGQITALRLVLAGAAYALMIGVALLTRSSPERTLWIAIAGGSVFTGAIAGALSSMFTAQEEMHVSALFGLLSSVATAVFVVAALAAGAGLLGTFIAVSLANLPPLGYLLVMWRRREPGPRLRASARFWGTALRQSYPYAILGVIGLVFFRIDSLMLTWIKGPEANGIYTAAYRLLDAVTDAPGVIVAAMFPMLARLHKESRAKLRRTYTTVVVVLALLGLPVMLGMIVLADPIITLLYGDGFERSVMVLRLLSVAVFLIFVDTANTMLLYSGDNLRTVLWLSLCTTAGNILLNLILIPRYSYNGAAVATILSTLLSLAVFTPVVLRYLRTEPSAISRQPSATQDV